MDINFPGKSGIEFVWQSNPSPLPALRITMLTIEEDSQLVFEFLQVGEGSAYLVKNLPPAEILESIQ